MGTGFTDISADTRRSSATKTLTGWLRDGDPQSSRLPTIGGQSTNAQAIPGLARRAFPAPSRGRPALAGASRRPIHTVASRIHGRRSHSTALSAASISSETSNSRSCTDISSPPTLTTTNGRKGAKAAVGLENPEQLQVGDVFDDHRRGDVRNVLVWSDLATCTVARK